IRSRSRRSGLAAVVRDETIPPAIVDQHEGAATDAARLRLDEVQYELYRDGGIDGAATLPEDPVSRLDRERVRGRYHELPARDRRLVRPPRSALRCVVLRAGGRNDCEQRDEQERASKIATNPTLHDDRRSEGR